MDIAKKFSPKNKQLISLYILGLIFVIVNIVLDPSILTSTKRIATLAIQFAPLMLCAMAQTCILLTRGIDLSLGVTLSLMTTITASTMSDTTSSVIFSILITLLSGALVGLIMGSVVTFGRIPAIIVTLAFSYIWKGVALYILPTPGGMVHYGLSSFISGYSGIPAAAIVVLICLLLWKLFKNSSAGIAVYSVGDNESVAFNNGINVKKARISAYVCSGLLIAVAGILLVCQTGSGDPTVGETFQMNSIAAAVLGGVSFLGGVGQMKGVIIGSFVITSLINILFFAGVSPFYQYIVQGLILIVAIGIRVVSFYKKGGK